MSVNQSSASGNFGNKVHTVLIDGIPVLGFMNTLSISFSEFTVRLKVEHSSRQLSHWVHMMRKVFNELFSFMGNNASISKFLRDRSKFSFVRDISSQQKP